MIWAGRSFGLTIAAALGLGACAPAMTEPDMAPTCLAESYQGLVGGSEENALETLADLVLFSEPPPDIRYIGPGDAVTMDFRPDRMNIELDATGTVTRVYCG